MIKPTKLLSILLIFLMFFAVISIFLRFSPENINKAQATGTALTNVANTVTDTQISASTSHKIDFTTYTAIPADGKILITFPASFDVSSAAFSAWSGFDGGQFVSINSQVVTITRDGAGTESAAGGKYITLSGITNINTAGTNYTVTVETQNAAGTTLDGPTSSYYFSICTNACHTSTYQIPWVSTISTSTKHTTKFTTGSAIPADGKIKITFPSGFDITNASTTTSLWSDFDGGLSLSVDSQTITITRDGTGSSTAAGAKYIVLNNITNHSTASSSYYAILESTDASDTNIEGPTSIRFSINNTGLGGLADTPMPWYRQNSKAQGRSPYQGPTYGTIKWGYTVEGSGFSTSYKSSSIIDSDGTIYVPNQNNNKLYALNSDGTLKWTTSDLGGDITGPTISSNGTIYIHVLGRGIYTVNSITGVATHLFVDHCSQYYSTSPPPVMIASDGTIIFATCQTSAEGGDGKIQKLGGLNPDGTLKWKNFDADQRFGSLSIADDGTIYLSEQWLSTLNAINPDGITKWQSSFTPGGGAYTMSTPAIGDDNVIYTINRDYIYAINSNGTQKWAYQTEATGATYGASVGISPDDSIAYFGARDGKFYAINTVDGTLSWSFDTGGMFLSSPIIGTDGIVYFGRDKLYAFTSAGDLKWSYNSGTSATPAIISDGTMYTVSDDGYVYAFQPWTLSASISPTGYYEPGDTLTFTVTTSMLATDPVTSEANQVQVYDATGSAILTTLAYSSTSGGNTIWTGTYVVPEGTADNTYTATIEAASVNVETDTTVNFASAPTNSNNTGITTTVDYVVDTTAPVDFTPTADPSTWTADTTPAITFSTTDATAGIDYYQVKIDSGSYATQTSPYTTSELSDGEHTITVKAVDKAGNERIAGSITVYIDTTAPTGTSLSFGAITTDSITVQVSGSSDTNTGLHATAPYYFQETTTSTAPGWQASTSWQHSSLSKNTQYTYQVKARDNTDAPNVSNFTTAQSKYTLIQIPTGISCDDVGVNSLTISGTGTISNLTSGSSGLYFDETSGNSGGADSNWTQSNSYQNTGLSENTQYTYRVKGRNGDSTETYYTSESSQYTLADTPTNLTATKPSNENNKMNLTVDAFPNDTSSQSGYYFYRGDDEAAHNSGWIQTNTWQDTDFECNAHYTWYVKYRNGDSVETSTISVTSTNHPNPCGGVPLSFFAQPTQPAPTSTPTPAIKPTPAPAPSPTTPASASTPALPTLPVSPKADIIVRKQQIQTINKEAKTVSKSDIKSLLSTLPKTVKRSIQKESQTAKTLLAPLITPEIRVSTQNYYALTSFITYGTNTTQSLGPRERAGTVNSFKSTFNRLPETQTDWSDVIKIANGRWPTQKNQTKEAQSEETFKKIYLREPDRDNPYDDAAIILMAYGLRSKDRNLDKEKTAISVFKRIFSKNPISASDWDTVRAIAYSGARR